MNVKTWVKRWVKATKGWVETVKARAVSWRERARRRAQARAGQQFVRQFVATRTQLSAQNLLFAAMVESVTTADDLQRALDRSPEYIGGILLGRPSLYSLAEALHVCGKRLVVTVEPLDAHARPPLNQVDVGIEEIEGSEGSATVSESAGSPAPAPGLHRYHVVWGHAGGPYTDAAVASAYAGVPWGTVDATSAEDAVRQIDAALPGSAYVRSWYSQVYLLSDAGTGEPGDLEFRLHIIVEDGDDGEDGDDAEEAGA